MHSIYYSYKALLIVSSVDCNYGGQESDNYVYLLENITNVIMKLQLIMRARNIRRLCVYNRRCYLTFDLAGT